MKNNSLLDSDKKNEFMSFRLSLKQKIMFKDICEETMINPSKYFEKCVEAFIHNRGLDFKEILNRTKLDLERNVKRSIKYMIKDFWETQYKIQKIYFATCGGYDFDFFKDEVRLLKLKFDKLEPELKGSIQSEVSSICALNNEERMKNKLHFLTQMYKLQNYIEDKRK